MDCGLLALRFVFLDLLQRFDLSGQSAFHGRGERLFMLFRQFVAADEPDSK